MTMDVSRSEFERLEAVVQQTAAAVHELAPVVQSNATSIAKIADVVSSNRESLARHTEPKGISTPTLVGAVTVLIMFGGFLLSFVVAVGTLAYWPLTAHDAQQARYLEEMGRQFVDHVSDGHPERIEEQISALGLRVDANRDQLATISTRVYENNGVNAAVNAAQWERVRALEREQYENGPLPPSEATSAGPPVTVE